MAENDSAAPAAQRTFTIHYEKSPHYREVSCDGSIGSVTPDKKLWAAFYSERYPLPRAMTFAAQHVDGERLSIDEKSTPLYVESKEGIVRNVEFSVYMDLTAAKRVHEWLGTLIRKFESEQQ